MKSQIGVITLGALLLLSYNEAFADPVYCPQRSGYINVGMTEEEVINACGQPISKQKSNLPAMQQIPVKQLIYTSLNGGSSAYPGLNSAFYDQWSLPSGSTGVSLQVDIINNKVSAVRINGSGTNAVSICQGQSIKVGDNPNQVYSACGAPNLINSTFINQPIPSKTQPEIWVYQLDQFHPAINLTFVNGQLQSIH